MKSGFSSELRVRPDRLNSYHYNTKFIIFDTKSIVFNTEFISFWIHIILNSYHYNTEFISFWIQIILNSNLGSDRSLCEQAAAGRLDVLRAAHPIAPRLVPRIAKIIKEWNNNRAFSNTKSSFSGATLHYLCIPIEKSQTKLAFHWNSQALWGTTLAAPTCI